MDAGLVRQLLTDKSISKHLIKHPDIYDLCHALVGDSFLTLPDTPRWKHQRKLTAMGMRQRFLEHTADVVLDLLYTQVFPALDGSSKSENVGGSKSTTREVGEWSTRLAAEVLGLVAFSHSFGGLEAEEATTSTKKKESLFDIYQNLNRITSKRSLRPPFMNVIQFEENRIFNGCAKTLNTTIQEIVDRRLAMHQESSNKANGYTKDEHKQETRGSTSKTREYTDLLSYLIEDDNGEHRLTKKELLGNVRMFMFAGQDTTAIVLSHALYDLAQHPSVQEKLQTEVDALFSKCKHGDNPSYGDIMKLEYLDAVVKEALRLHSPVGVARENCEEITLTKGDGTKYVIPKGSAVYFYPHLTSQGDGRTKGMAEFVPERFLRLEKTAANHGRDACYMPFSVGPRDCVGRPLAMAELKHILSHTIHRYRVQKTEGSDDPIKMMLITIKAHKLMLDFERRGS